MDISCVGKEMKARICPKDEKIVLFSIMKCLNHFGFS